MWNDFLETQKEKIAAAQKLSDATEKKKLIMKYLQGIHLA